MKKIILLVLVLLVCGCSKKLTCTYELDYEDIEINNKIIFNFKDNTYKQKDIMTFEDEEAATDYFKDVEEYKEEYNLILEKNKIKVMIINVNKIYNLFFIFIKKNHNF